MLDGDLTPLRDYNNRHHGCHQRRFGDISIKKGRMPTPKHPAIFFFSISYPKSPYSGDCCDNDCFFSNKVKRDLRKNEIFFQRLNQDRFDLPECGAWKPILAQSQGVGF